MANRKKSTKKRSAKSKARTKKTQGQLTDEELKRVAGGATVFAGASGGGNDAGGIPDVFVTPSPGGGPVPIPFPNIGDESGGGHVKSTEPGSGSGSSSGDSAGT